VSAKWSTTCYAAAVSWSARKIACRMASRSSTLGLSGLADWKARPWGRTGGRLTPLGRKVFDPGRFEFIVDELSLAAILDKSMLVLILSPLILALIVDPIRLRVMDDDPLATRNGHLHYDAK
jgi:hypothetical protein